MALLDKFEKLINEHGSSTILRERIVLANDKFALLESENAALKEKCSVLESENTVLKTESQTLKLNCQQAEQKIRQLEKNIIEIHNKTLNFDEKTGTWIDQNKLHYCPKCKSSEILSPLKTEKYGWYCDVCEKSYPDPNQPRPKSKRNKNWRTA